MTPVTTSYSPLQLACPRCRVPLRMRLQPGDPREFECPECHLPLTVVEHDGGITLQPAQQVVQPAERSVSPSITFAAPLRASQRWWTRTRDFVVVRSKDPLFVTWTVAGAATVAIAIAFWTTSDEPLRHPKRSSQVAATPETPAEVAQDPASDEILNFAVAPVEAPRVAVVLDPVEAARPVVAPPPNPRDLIAAALSRRVLRFEQANPAPFDQLRFQLEEMIGFPIEYGFVGAEERRDEPVAVSLTDVTMEELLTEVAARAGLKPTVTDTGIRLTPMGTAKANP